MVITLTPEIERALAEQARKSGTSPERLALESLRERFLGTRQDTAAEPAGTMADFLSGYVGVLHSSERVPGGARLSEKVGKRFTEILLEKRGRARS